MTGGRILLSAPISELGYQVASPHWWTDASYEATPELRFPLSIDQYSRMRRQDAQVMSVLRAVTLPIRRTSWRVDPAGAKITVARFVADQLGLPVKGRKDSPTPRTRDRFSWSEHLRLALTMLPNGFSPFEQVYRPEGGRLHLRKLAWRPPQTILRIQQAADGGLVGVNQYNRGDLLIPANRLVVYVNEREEDWYGQSLLRSAYKFWILKDRALRIQAQTLERNGLGIPVYYGADQRRGDMLDSAEIVARESEEIEAGKTLARSMRAGDNSGAAAPFGAKIKLQGVEGTLPDADKPIRYYDEQIARAVLANFLNLGGDNSTGSYALGETFADFFVMSLQTVAMQVADTATQHIVEDLVDLNFGEQEPAPRIVFDEIGSRHPATSEAIRSLVDSGVITADQQLERHVRTAYGLPEADISTARPKGGMNGGSTDPAGNTAPPEDQ